MGGTERKKFQIPLFQLMGSKLAGQIALGTWPVQEKTIKYCPIVGNAL